jgi:uncharacterized membrane protein
VTESEAEAPAHQRELARIGAFSDAVMAVAITLLVLKIDVPQLGGHEVGELDERLLDLWPDVFAYGLSFAVIGRYWIVHHRFFAGLARWDGRLVALNLGFLAFLVLIPFASDLVGRYDNETSAVITYAVVLVGAGLMNWTVIRHAVRNDLVAPSQRAHIARFGQVTALALPAVFGLSIPIAFVSPHAAEAFWLLTIAAHPSWWGHTR